MNGRTSCRKRLTPITTGDRIPIVPASSLKGLGDKMKEYLCVEVNHHKNIAKVTQEYIMQGWSLHTYQATGEGAIVKHYLLFERG